MPFAVISCKYNLPLVTCISTGLKEQALALSQVMHAPQSAHARASVPGCEAGTWGMVQTRRTQRAGEQRVLAGGAAEDDAEERRELAAAAEGCRRGHLHVPLGEARVCADAHLHACM